MGNRSGGGITRAVVLESGFLAVLGLFLALPPQDTRSRLIAFLLVPLAGAPIWLLRACGGSAWTAGASRSGAGSS